MANIISGTATEAPSISSLLRQLGVSNDDFAKACLATLIGLPDLDTKSRAVPAYEALIDLVLALK